MSDQANLSSDRVQSPCVNVCKVDDSGVCVGCFRTLSEIASWRDWSDAERHACLNRIFDGEIKYETQ